MKHPTIMEQVAAAREEGRLLGRWEAFEAHRTRWNDPWPRPQLEVMAPNGERFVIRFFPVGDGMLEIDEIGWQMVSVEPAS